MLGGGKYLSSLNRVFKQVTGEGEDFRGWLTASNTLNNSEINKNKSHPAIHQLWSNSVVHRDNSRWPWPTSTHTCYGIEEIFAQWDSTPTSVWWSERFLLLWRAVPCFVWLSGGGSPRSGRGPHWSMSVVTRKEDARNSMEKLQLLPSTQREKRITLKCITLVSHNGMNSLREKGWKKKFQK